MNELPELAARLAPTVVIVVVIAMFLLPQAVRILREYERGVIFRLGKLIGAKGPGIVFPSLSWIKWCGWICAW